jgi:4-hydroxybenzoate polyprenyltransferase
MMPRAVRIRFFYLQNLLRLVRVQNLFIIALTQYLVRIFLIGGKESWLHLLTDPKMFLLSTSTLLMASAGYVINDYYDVKIDAINRPAQIIVGRTLRRRYALILNWLLNTVGILLGFYLSFTIGIFNFSAGFFLWLYSNQLKRLPFIGNLTIALLTAASVLVVVAYYPDHQLLVFAFAGFAFFIALIREIIKDMEDMRGDATFGCQTLPVVWGIRRTKNMIYWLTLLLVVSLSGFSYFLKTDWLIGYGALFVLLPLGWLVYRLAGADTRKDFNYLSQLCKIIMLGGVTTMVLL